jgi:large subunit ribosomal protein L17
VKKLFDDIAPRSADRKGGYTRIIKLGQRKSDSAAVAFLEWVDAAEAVEEAAPARKGKKGKSAKSEEPAESARKTKKSPPNEKKTEAEE